MIGYKDMTFCKEITCKHTAVCKRYLSDKDREDAIRWWGNPNFPVAFYVDAPECYEENKDELA